jgi:uncharacterized protein (TIGR02246 family)
MRVIELMFFISLIGITSAQQPPSDKSAIEQSARAFITAYDAGDAGAVAALWTPDGELSVGTQTIKGQAEIKKLYEEHFKANPDSKMEVKIQSVRNLAPNLLLEEGVASITGGAAGTKTASAYTAIHTKLNGKWLMASVRESEVPLPPAPAKLEELAGLVGDWRARGDAAHVDVKFDWMSDKHFLKAETTIHPKDKLDAVPGGMQITGVDPLTGQLVSWFFTADGGHSSGVWVKSNNRWLINTIGATADGAATTATNILYQPHQDVLSWQSVDRTVDGQSLPNIEEIVLERVTTSQPAEQHRPTRVTR